MVSAAQFDVQASPLTLATGRTIVSIYVSPTTSPPAHARLQVRWSSDIVQEQGDYTRGLTRAEMVFRQAFVVDRTPAVGDLLLTQDPYLIGVFGYDASTFVQLASVALHRVLTTSGRATSAAGTPDQDRPSYGWS